MKLFALHIRIRNPGINRTEKLLPRKTRTTLAQLRSSYSTYLNKYLHRINPATYPSPSCPQCDVEEHSTNHLFDCTAAPTDLTTGSLWEDPPAVAAFLGLPTHEDAVLDDNDWRKRATITTTPALIKIKSSRFFWTLWLQLDFHVFGA